MPKQDLIKNRLEELFSSGIPDISDEKNPEDSSASKEDQVQPQASVAALVEGDKLFQDLFDKSADALLILEKGHFIDCNNAALAMLRFKSKQDILSLHPSQLSPERQPDGRLSFEKAEEMFQIALERGNHRFEWFYRRSVGEDFPVEVLLTPIKIGDKQIIVAVWRDISDRISLVQTQNLLGKRVRELNCLSDIGHRIDERPPLPELLNWVAQRIPAAMQYPDICIAAITLYDEVYGPPETLNLTCKMVGGIRTGDELLGYVQIGYKEQRSFLDDESAFIGGIVGRVTSYIESLQFTEQIQRRTKELTTLNEMARSLSSIVDEKRIAEIVYQNVCQLINVDDFYIAYYEAEKKEVTFPLTYVYGQRVDVNSRPLGEGLTDYIIRHRTPLLFGDNILDDMESLGIKFLSIGDDKTSLSWLGVPIVYGDSVLGVISVQSVRIPNLYKEHDQDLLISIASQAAVAIQNARAFAQIQEALDENLRSRERYELAAAGSSDGLWDWNISKNEVYFSSRWKTMIGYADEEITNNFSEFERRLHPEDHDRVMKALSDYLEGRIPVFELDYRFQHKNGSYRWILARGALLRDENEVPVRMAGSHSDITERRLAELTIEKRAAELETVAKLSMSVSNIMDPEKILQVVVDQAKREFVLYHVHIYLLDDLQQTLVLSAGSGEIGRKMVAQKWQIPLNLERSLVARAARERQGVIANDIRSEPDFLPNVFLPNTRSEMAVPLVVGENILGVLDVQSEEENHFTEEDLSIQTTLAAQVAIALQNSILYIETQNALADTEVSQKLLRSIMDATPDWIFVKDQEHRYRLVNKGFADALHIQPEDFIGKNDLDLGFPEERVKGNSKKGIRGFWADDRLVMESGQAQIYPNDPVLIDGDIHIFHTYKTPIRDADGKVTGVLAFGRDVTEREELLAETDALYSGANRIIRARTTEEVLQSIIEATNLKQFDRAGITFFDSLWTTEVPETGVIAATWESSGNEPLIPLGSIYSLRSMPFSVMIMRDTPTFISNIDTDERLDSKTRAFVATIGKTIALFPLVSGGDWFGWLNLASERPFNISETTLRQIESLVSLGAAVIHTQRLQQGMEERLREMSELQRTMSHEAWSTYLSRSQHGISGYVFDNLRTRPLSIEEISSFHPSIDSQGLETAQPHIYKTSLAIGGETVGILGVREDPNIGISEEEKALMEAIAEQVSQALERTRLIEQTQKSAVELQAVARVSSVSSTILDPIYLLQSVVDLAKKSFGLYHAHAYMLDETGSKLVLAAGAGDIGREMVAKGWEILIDEESIVTRAARLRQGQIVNNVNQEKGFLPNPLLPDTISEMAIPMIVGNRLLGVFDAQSDRINYFTDEDLRTYNTLASQTAVALQNAQLFAEQAMTVERLRELDHLKSSFMANMSHELRTPLNSILGFTQVILEGIDGPLTDFMDTDLQLIEKNGKHLLNLINEVLDMAKIESGRLSLTFEAVDLRELLGDVLETTSPQAKDKNIYLRLDANPEDDLVVTADQIRMRQVMLNLVANAIKFTDTGGVTIHINKTGDLLRIRFLDTGIGIPIDKLETIFEAFSQVDTSTTRKAGGTGLGLPISRRLVEMHGGRLWAESKGMSGDGSTFHLDIPVHPPIK